MASPAGAASAAATAASPAHMAAMQAASALEARGCLLPVLRLPCHRALPSRARSPTCLALPAPHTSAPQDLKESMMSHLKLHFNNHDRNDEKVLGAYPSTIRRRVLRYLYLDVLQGSLLFDGARQRFLDAVLAAARVEAYLPNVSQGVCTHMHSHTRRRTRTRARAVAHFPCTCRNPALESCLLPLAGLPPNPDTLVPMLPRRVPAGGAGERGRQRERAVHRGVGPALLLPHVLCGQSRGVWVWWLGGWVARVCMRVLGERCLERVTACPEGTSRVRPGCQHGALLPCPPRRLPPAAAHPHHPTLNPCRTSCWT